MRATVASNAKPPQVVVVGGANVDVKSKVFAAPVLATSNPGFTTTSPGGVARNIAHNLVLLGLTTELVSVVGNDELGQGLLTQIQTQGIGTTHITRSNQPTGTYSAILDEHGGLLVAVSSMALLEDLTPAQIRKARPSIEAAAFVVADANTPQPALQELVNIAQQYQKPLILEPVSVAKSQRVWQVVQASLPIFMVTPNQDELFAMTGCNDTNQACAILHDLNIEAVWVRMGAQGSVLSQRNHSPQKIAAFPTTIADVTGAGDAALAGCICALCQNLPILEAVRFGHAAAAITIASHETVASELSVELGVEIGVEIGLAALNAAKEQQ